MISTPKKAHQHLFKMRGEMEEFLRRKQEHDFRKSQPKQLSLVDHMNAKGLESNWTTRKKLASQYGIKDYAGTSHQHGRMLAILQNAAPSNPTE